MKLEQLIRDHARDLTKISKADLMSMSDAELRLVVRLQAGMITYLLAKTDERVETNAT